MKKIQAVLIAPILLLSILFFIFRNEFKPMVIDTGVVFKPSNPIKVSVNPVVLRINEIRKSHGLRELHEDVSLNGSALDKACDMRDRDYWSHKDPDGNMSWHLFSDHKYRYSLAGENLAKNCKDMGCIDLWMFSKTHKDIILNPDFEDIGVGRCESYLVIHLGKWGIFQ